MRKSYLVRRRSRGWRRCIGHLQLLPHRRNGRGQARARPFDLKAAIQPSARALPANLVFQDCWLRGWLLRWRAAWTTGRLKRLWPSAERDPKKEKQYKTLKDVPFDLII